MIDCIQLNIQFHIEQEYGEALVQLDKGLTDYQISKRNCLSYLHRGHQLRKLLIAFLQIVFQLHWFKLNEKEKQAKVFLVIMQALETTKVYEPIHKGGNTGG